MDKRPQLSAKNKTDLMPNNASCKRWDTPKILVTNLAELTASQVVCIYQKRWQSSPELGTESGLGLGEHQVSGDKNRSEKSVGIAVLAYLFVLRVCHHEIIPGKPWRTFLAAACVAATGHDEPGRA